MINHRKNVLKYCISTFLLFCLISNTYAYKIRFTWYDSRKYIYLADIATYYGMQLNKDKKGCELNSKYTRIKIKYSSKEIYINGRKVFLSEPTIYNGNNPAISETDFLLLLEPILRKTVLKKHKFNTVIIDPGHGGKDPGAQGKYYKEKDIAYSIALKLKNILTRNGFRVILTRTRNQFIPLKSRPALTLKYSDSIFVSIHCNATANSSVDGVETFIYTPANTTSTNGGKIAPRQMYGNIYDKNNARLGYEIQKQLISSEKYNKTDRGLKRAQFAVLKYCPVPAVLVETGFISNSSEERLLGTNAYQNDTALAIARGIVTYRNAMLSGKN